MPETRRKLRSASEEEIRNLIRQVASGSSNGYFYASDIEAALLREGIQPKSVNWRQFLDMMYHIDDFGPKKTKSIFGAKPYSINNPVKPITPSNPLFGTPSLDMTSGIVDAKYRKKGIKHHGISRQPPQDLRPK